MKLDLSKDELKRLIDLLSISDWIICAQDVDSDEDEDKKPYLKLLQKIYGEAYRNGLKDCVEKSEDSDEFFFNDDFKEESLTHQFIDEYEDACFWDNLIEKLAERDYIKETKHKEIDEVGEDDEGESYRMKRFARITELEQQYNEEFEKNGLKYLELNTPKDKLAKVLGK